MLKYNKFLAIDLELNQPSNSIIQVGVAIGGRLQSEEEYIVRSWLIDPGEPIHPEIVELTGITDAMIQADAVSWEQLAKELTQLVEAEAPYVNPVVWGYPDSQELKEAFKRQGMDLPLFGRRWLDCKTWHQLYAFAQDKNPSGGLASVMQKYKLKFQGKQHRADVDAFNTLRLFFALLSRQSTFEGVAQLLKAT